MRTFFLCAIAALFVTSGMTALAAVDPSAKYDEHLRAALESGPASARVIVMTQGSPVPAAADATAWGATITWTYSIIDAFAATVPAPALERIAARADVTGIWLDRPTTTTMDVSHRAIEADKAWGAGYTGAGITVAVIDTGIDRFHSFFTGAIVSCVSTIGGLVTPECTDSDGHGTHVAGTVASRDSTYPGVAKGATIAAVRVLHAAGTGTSSDIVAGIDWVRANKDRVSPPIRVATMSIGFLEPGCGDGTGPEAAAANNLVAAGVPFTVAAGNAGHNGCTIDGASAASRVTTIAAVDDRSTVPQGDDVIAGFSSGGSSKNNKPDAAFPGVGITSAFIGAGVLIATMDGTSMATPHAAGTMALLLQKEPGLTAQQVKDRVTGTAIKTDATGSTFNYVYGHGLGNACRALQLSGCATVQEPAPPKDVHVGALSLALSHGNGKNPPHIATTTVTVKDSTGAVVSGASVAIEVTSPEGTKYAGSGTTDGSGVASIAVSQKGGGHGAWTSCVTGIAGNNMRYVASSNVATCRTASITT